MKIAGNIFAVLIFCAGCGSKSHSEVKDESHSASEQCIKVNVLLQALDKQVGRGAEAAFSNLWCLDGGELEDVYRALGVQFTKEPREILSAMKATNTAALNAAPMLVMLPLSYVDDACAGKLELHNRRRVVSENVDEESIRAVFFDALDEAITRKTRNCEAT